MNESDKTPEQLQDEKFRAEFQVGGVDRELPAEEQLEQLYSYLDAHYDLPDFTPPWKGGAGDPDPADNYIARLADRTTHAAMLMLGSGLDHSMPGVVWADGVEASEVPEVGGRLFTPSEPTGRWAVSFHSGGWWRGSGNALEMSWRPEVAAAAERSGTIILDLDYPLAPQSTVKEMNQVVRKAIGYAKHHNASSIAAWGYSSGAALAAMNASLVDALVLTFPDLASVASLPDEISAGQTVPAAAAWPRSLVQIALQDEIADRPEGIDGVDGIEVREYVARHRVSTPEVARQKIADVADFLRTV
ncbi:alpha/beta hydrolase [Corynebacterium suedekumii]|uniref:Alpha/beta hydrolase fold domain-containing protein n=1 Tax=Corynebacterium suedekumii TaxID=3049801 RepID=A0ABY8VU66_9CORY|nr:alpha/beta hydrolase fold domain-containing protein [Corynebacterium suedekumii]WIM71090.1 alpha/beta hydrolase fold domain-containing protein [Corynebacterium suedekumii]